MDNLIDRVLRLVRRVLFERHKEPATRILTSYYYQLIFLPYDGRHNQRPPASRRYRRIYWEHVLLPWGNFYYCLLLALAHETALPSHSHFKFGLSR